MVIGPITALGVPLGVYKGAAPEAKLGHFHGIALGPHAEPIQSDASWARQIPRDPIRALQVKGPFGSWGPRVIGCYLRAFQSLAFGLPMRGPSSLMLIGHIRTLWNALRLIR